MKVFAAIVFLALLLLSSSYGHIHAHAAFISSFHRQQQLQLQQQQQQQQQPNDPTTRGRGGCVGGAYHYRIFPQVVPQQKKQQQKQATENQRQRPTMVSSTTTLSVTISSPSPSSSSSSSGNNNNATTTTTERTTDDSLEITPSQDDERDHRELMTRSSPVTTFETLEECLSLMDRKPANGDLTVVLFFAHYCKKCHEAYKSYKRLASSNPSIDFTRIETSLMSLKQLRLVGVSRVPFIQIYRDGCCVASFAASSPPSSKLESQLQETIDSCQQRSKTDWMKFCQHHVEEIQRNKHARQTIKSKVVPSSPFSSSLSTKWTQDQDQHHRRSSTVMTIISERQLLMAIDKTNKTVTGSRDGSGSEFFNNIFESSTIGHDDGGNEFMMNDSSSNNSINNNNNSKLAVILFHSRFGHASLRAQHQFTTIAEARNRYIDSFDFFRIESSTFPETTLKGLGVSTHHPHIQIYKDGRCVASFSIPQTYIFTKMVRGSLDECIQRTKLDQWNDFMNQFADDISSIQQIVDSIRQRQVGP